MKICQIAFSTNRLNYLNKTLESQSKLDYENVEVHKILIDDYPHGRDNERFLSEIKNYNFNEIIFHKENIGITKTWQEFFDLIKNKNYDYILHHEDDIVLLQNIKIFELIKILEKNKDLFQIQLKRNNWFSNEVENNFCKEDDIIFDNYRLEKQNNYFWTLFSIYPAWISKEPILQETGFNPSEGVLSFYLYQKYKMYGGILKGKNGQILVNHIGEYTQGKKVCEGEPGWEGFKNFDPLKKYNSKTGYEYIDLF